jgi:hypothetical protein
VQFPGAEGKYAISGIIRNVGKEADKIILGVMFEEMDSPVKNRLADFIDLIAQAGKKAH